jgi:serine/threonine protein kinase/tetratricopeptide (TPR) repeat protein
MNAVTWARAKQLIAEATERPEAERERYVVDHCADLELRREILTMLANSDAPLSDIVAARALRLGDQLGPYRIEALLGRGGMGEVYRASDPRLGREVAIKVLPVAFSADRDRLRRFEHEARAAAALNHPNILTVHEIGTHEGQPYLVSELLEGQTLREALRHGPLATKTAIGYTIQICQGLAAAHDKDIIHRDLKPENLFITQDGRVKILDFGLARVAPTLASEDSTMHTTVAAASTPGVILGTLGYTSPEQVQGAQVDATSDLFSLGCVLYEMIAGTRLFTRDSAIETMNAILTDEAPALASLGKAVPSELDHIIAHCLEKNPSERFQSARDLAFDLRTFLGSGSADTPFAARPRHKRWIIAAAIGALIAVGSLALGPGRRLFHPATVLAFQERDWVLISAFENRTGEPVFDGTLEYALERELSNSTFVNVVPRERIEDALRLMQRPLDTPIDRAVAREISIRDGGIKALLTGRVEKLGASYVLSTELVDAVRGVSVGSVSQEANGQDQVLTAVHRESDLIRENLGERLQSIRESDQKLEKVTTPSLRALQLYSQAMALIAREPDWAPASELLRQAILDDPNFASAHIVLAHMLRNLRKPKDEYMPIAQRAVDLSARTTAEERYFIQGSFYSMQGDDEKAASNYEALLRLKPDHYWAANNLYGALQQLGRFAESVPAAVRAAKLLPNSFRANFLAAGALAQSKDLVRAQVYADRAEQLVTAGDLRQYASGVGWLHVLAVYRHWLDDDTKAALDTLDHETKTLPASAPEYAAVVTGFASAYALLGRISTAKELLQTIPDEQLRDQLMVGQALTYGDQSGVQTYLSNHNKPSSLLALALESSGRTADAEKVLSKLDRTAADVNPITVSLVEGRIALAQGRRADAIASLQTLLDDLRRRRLTGWLQFFLATESLAEAWVRQGDRPRAVGILEAISAERASTVSSLTGGLWLRTQMRLALLYRQSGREVDAEKLEAKLVKLLAYADPDFPFLVELKSRSLTR